MNPRDSDPPGAGASPAALHGLAMQRFREGNLPEAIHLMTRAAAASPGAPHLHNDLGSLHHAAGDFAAAVACYRRAVALAPHNERLWLNLGDALADRADYPASVAAYERAITARPQTFPEALNNLAAVLLAGGQVERARDCCLAAIAVRPDYALAYNTLGAAWLRLGKSAEAVAACRRSCELRPASARAWFNLGSAYDAAGDRSRAADALGKAVELDPNLAEARYDLAALGQAAPLPKMPPGYVVRLFDSYSAGFDQHLVGRLSYRVPEMLLQAVGAVRVDNLDRAADLGCGTGLVGRVFRPRVRHLVGVDLSPRMIDLARAGGGYDELILADAVESLANCRDPFDLLLAADFFIYYGDTAACFAAAAPKLRPGGLFAFSVETIDASDAAAGGAPAEYILRPTRRYAHSADYIRGAAAGVGLSCKLERSAVLRTELDQPVAGTIFVLRRE